LNQNGFADRVSLDTTSAVLADESDVMGYYSWGSNDPAIRRRRFGFQFMPGALAGMFASTDARTFTEPPPGWKVGAWTDRKAFYAGSPQSLTGDLVREGVTGAVGYVAEPYLDGSVRPNVLFPAYVSGFNLGESYYLAMPSLSWQTVVVGDPLCQPFTGQLPLKADDIEQGVDADTGLPKSFSERAVRVAAGRTSTREAALLLVRSDALLARDDRAAARDALERLVALEPRLAAQQMLLASLYEEGGDHDKAIERYRVIVKNDPSNAAALNNLAFSLAVRKNRAEEALPLAERAFAVAPANPAIQDTLGWICHLLGDDARGAPLLERAARTSPSSGEIHLHLAVVYATGGMLDAAAKALARAVELDPALEKRDEAAGVRARVQSIKK
jgi:Tfp pilus assembly protein PilF